MNAILELVSAYGRDAAIAASVVLAIGASAALVCRAPAHRQRVCELAVVIAVVTGVLAFVPLRMRGAETVPAHVDTAPVWTVFEPTGVADVVSTPPVARAAAPVRPLVSAELAVRGLVVVGAGVALYGLLGWVLLARAVSRTRAVTGKARALAEELHGGPMRLRVCDRSERPYCCGILRPMVLVPASLLAREEALRAVLLHELVHLRRRDPLGRALMTAAAPLLFWQPLFWWLSRDARRSAELVADDVAAQGMGKRRYALELIRLAERAHDLPALGSSAVPVLRDPEDLFRRMEMLMHRTTPLAAESTPFHRALRIVGATALFAGVTLAWGRPQDVRGPQDDLVGSDDLRGRGEVPVSDGFDARGDVLGSDDFRARGGTLVGPVGRTTKKSIVLQTVVLFRDSADVGHFTVSLLRRGVEVQGLRLEPGSERQLRLQLSGGNILDEVVAAVENTDGIDLVSVMVRNAKPIDETAPPRMHGKVLDVDASADPARVAINLGRSDGVVSGSRFWIHDGSTYKGSLQIDSVSDGMSVGRVTTAPDGSRVHAGDTVATDPETGRADRIAGFVDRSPVVPVITGSVVRADESLYTTVVVIDRGSNDGLSKGDAFEVYSGDTYKGRVEVVDVQPKSCTGIVRLLTDGSTIESGDTAATRLSGDDPADSRGVR